MDLQIQHNLCQNPSRLCRNWQVNPKIHMEFQGTYQMSNTILKKKTVEGWLTFWIQNSYKATIINSVVLAYR